LDEVWKDEYPRNGEFGHSPLREKLKASSKFRSLWFFDLMFRLIRWIVFLGMKIFPQLKQMLHQYRQRPYDYSKAGKWQIELRQILITIMEQADNLKDERVCDLVNKGMMFNELYVHERLLPVVEKLLGPDFKLYSLNVRSPRKDGPKQDMHVDFPWSVSSGECFACNALFLLDHMNAENGATRVVPGTQNSAMMPYEKMNDHKAIHSEEIIVEAKAGDVLLINGHVWHGGTINRNGKRRRLIQTYFTHKAHPPQQFQRFQLRDEVKKKLSPLQLSI
jgi:hypothetical protein